MDSRASELRAQALRETHLRELRGGVRPHVRHAALADDRRDDDDVALALPAEHAERGPGGEVGADVVDLYHLPRLRRCDLVDGARDAEAGVAHHHVKPSEAIDDATDE